jgi:YHS domain-containing protein
MKFLILRLLLPLLLFLVVRSLLRGLFAGGGAPSRPAAPKVPAAGELRKDPVCGTYVSAVGTPREQIGREVVYFCSEACRGKFLAARRG